MAQYRRTQILELNPMETGACCLVSNGVIATKGASLIILDHAAASRVERLNLRRLEMNGLSDAPLGSLKKVSTMEKSIFGWYSDGKNIVYRQENGKLYLGR